MPFIVQMCEMRRSSPYPRLPSNWENYSKMLQLFRSAPGNIPRLTPTPQQIHKYQSVSQKTRKDKHNAFPNIMAKLCLTITMLENLKNQVSLKKPRIPTLLPIQTLQLLISLKISQITLKLQQQNIPQAQIIPLISRKSLKLSRNESASYIQQIYSMFQKHSQTF